MAALAIYPFGTLFTIFVRHADGAMWEQTAVFGGLIAFALAYAAAQRMNACAGMIEYWCAIAPHAVR